MHIRPPHGFFTLPFALLGVAAVILVASLVVGPLQHAPRLAHAQSTDLGCLSGYAWSDTIGWIDFTCANVPVRSDGTIEGYAWANPRDDVASVNNIGWISFNAADTASCGSYARITGTSLSGWAKALSADGNGWDGCISLSGTSPSYGVTLAGGTGSSGSLSGYAWGSDVVGWISFNCATGGPTGNNVCSTSNYVTAFSYTYVPPSPPTITLTANPSRVGNGDTTTLTYTVTNPPVGGCTLTSTSGYTSGSFTPSSGTPTATTTQPITVRTRFTLTCSTVSAGVDVGLIPVYIEQ